MSRGGAAVREDGGGGAGEDEEEELEEDDEAPIVDSTVSAGGSPAVALRSCRAAGRPLRWMERVKMERLKQVNGALPRVVPHSPSPPPTGPALPPIIGNGKLTTGMLTMRQVGGQAMSTDIFPKFISISQVNKCTAQMKNCKTQETR